MEGALVPDTTHLSSTDRAAAEKAVRDVTARSLRASERKDLDAAMEMIADDIVSFEHDAPLSYEGVDAVREVCKKGIDQMGDGLKLDFQELKTIVRDDIAVMWGFNIMKVDGQEMYSRATRVFQRQNGDWKAIHQHLSFPYDPETGEAKLDQKPN